MNDHDKVYCFMVYADSGSFNDDGTNNTSTVFALPVFFNGLFFGTSPSFFDSPASILLNSRGDAGPNDNVQNYINIGANNPITNYHVQFEYKYSIRCGSMSRDG